MLEFNAIFFLKKIVRIAKLMNSQKNAKKTLVWA